MIFNNLSFMLLIHRPTAFKYLEVRDAWPPRTALERVEINKPYATPNNSPPSGSLTGKQTLFLSALKAFLVFLIFK